MDSPVLGLTSADFVLLRMLRKKPFAHDDVSWTCAHILKQHFSSLCHIFLSKTKFSTWNQPERVILWKLKM
ncbi:hypothetical protein NPIL_306021 [Nephila pilipes]|uniref:Uncharacterized protein n=1 Tax=Nephila pilipes TaxID=299642 RepID=A0A8X6N245_NEPPI|nr:hypothetical protein NPIL_306021 [Nephila pilipes]